MRNNPTSPRLRRARKRIVAIGGAAISEAILPALKELGVSITTITSMTDSGGSTGALRKELNVHAAADIRRHILALSKGEKWKKDLFKFRFANTVVFDNEYRGYNFAGVLFAGIEKSTGDFEKTLKIIHDFMKVDGRCLPATMEKVNLFAKLEDGKILRSEDEIDVPQNRSANLKITDLWLEPAAKAYPKATRAIKEADYIFIGPGDLYSSVLACLLPKGIKESLKKAKAKIVYVCNIPNKPGETKGMTAGDYLSEIIKYTGLRKLDYVLVNDSHLKPKAEAVFIDHAKLEELAYNVISADFASQENPDHHDYRKVARFIKKII